MPLATRAGTEPIKRDEVTFHPLASPSRGTAQLAVWTTELAAGAVGEEHTVDREEIVVVQRGRVSALLGGERFEAGEGDAVIVPPDTPFALGNTSADEPALLIAFTTAGLKGTIGGETFPVPWAQ